MKRANSQQDSSATASGGPRRAGRQLQTATAPAACARPPPPLQRPALPCAAMTLPAAHRRRWGHRAQARVQAMRAPKRMQRRAHPAVRSARAAQDLRPLLCQRGRCMALPLQRPRMDGARLPMRPSAPHLLAVELRAALRTHGDAAAAPDNLQMCGYRRPLVEARLEGQIAVRFVVAQGQPEPPQPIPIAIKRASHLANGASEAADAAAAGRAHAAGAAAGEEGHGCCWGRARGSGKSGREVGRQAARARSLQAPPLAHRAPPAGKPLPLRSLLHGGPGLFACMRYIGVGEHIWSSSPASSRHARESGKLTHEISSWGVHAQAGARHASPRLET